MRLGKRLSFAFQAEHANGAPSYPEMQVLLLGDIQKDDGG
jgi:hypothetical protein